MPDFPIIDAHLHIWDPEYLDYPWLKQAPALDAHYPIQDYRAAAAPYEVEQMVFVQCECDRARYLDEVAWVAAAAERDPRITGIVAWAPLEKGDLARQELKTLARNPLVKGIRRIIQHEPDPIAFAKQPEFLKGIRLLADFDFSFDICIHHPQLPAAIDIVRACPDVRFILDHIGKPDIGSRIFQPWADHLQTLAKLPNIWCKVSGLVTEADHQHWQADDLLPYLTHALVTFGPDRVIFGGDWPVVTLASPLSRWIETLSRIVQERSAEENHRLFAANAREFYRLPYA